jgi:hypothetical protein
MNIRFRTALWLLGLFAPATRLMAQAPRTATAITGCYHVQLGPWSRSFGVNAAYHAIPSVIRLDTVAAAGGGYVVAPNISFPRGRAFPGTPRWIIRADSLQIFWSSGYQTTTLRLAITASDSLRGFATVGSDANEFGTDLPRADARARRQPCP